LLPSCDSPTMTSSSTPTRMLIASNQPNGSVRSSPNDTRSAISSNDRPGSSSNLAASSNRRSNPGRTCRTPSSAGSSSKGAVHLSPAGKKSFDVSILPLKVGCNDLQFLFLFVSYFSSCSI
jgi:hypothetical protein